jgi:hypothetical protein
MLIKFALVAPWFFVKPFRRVPRIHGPNGLPESFLKGHPDSSDRLWKLASALPEDCRFYVYGAPALVHPKSGVIFAFVDGIHYCLRLPNEVRFEAITAGAWTSNPRLTWTNTNRDLGLDWVFGTWKPEEFKWIQKAYESYGHSA